MCLYVRSLLLFVFSLILVFTTSNVLVRFSSWDFIRSLYPLVLAFRHIWNTFVSGSSSSVSFFSSSFDLLSLMIFFTLLKPPSTRHTSFLVCCLTFSNDLTAAIYIVSICLKLSHNHASQPYISYDVSTASNTFFLYPYGISSFLTQNKVNLFRCLKF